MKVKELISKLLKHDQELIVLIQQGEDEDYMEANAVYGSYTVDYSSDYEDDEIECVVINY